MKYPSFWEGPLFQRRLADEIMDLSKEYRVITITGPRQAGKTTLAKMVFPDLPYVSLEDPDIRNLAETDPRAFFRLYPGKLIIDEIQRVPKLLSYIQTIVDEKNILGQFILTGSHQLELNEAFTQSLAGRTALLALYPMSLQELRHQDAKVTKEEAIFKGFLPQVHHAGLNPTRYYRNYFQTYVERDVRHMIHVKDLSLFETFMRLCCGRIGQLLNINSLASEVGVNFNTIKNWLSILEASYIIFRLTPYFENLGKRLVKAPKLYFVEVGLAAYLLGLESVEQVSRDPLLGNLFENMVVCELLKARCNKGLDPSLYFYRDSNGNEVDLLYKMGNKLKPIEIKSAETFNPSFLKSIRYFNKVTPTRAHPGAVIYAGELTPTLTDGCQVFHFVDAAQALV